MANHSSLDPTLPLELQQMILTCFLKERTLEVPKNRFSPRSVARQDPGAAAAACLVSKAWQEQATAALYRYFFPGRSEPRLARTLRIRPELGRDMSEKSMSRCDAIARGTWPKSWLAPLCSRSSS